MLQVIVCPKCASKLKAPESFAGRRVSCPACKAPVQIPALPAPTRAPATNVANPPAADAPAASSAGMVEIQCPQCSKKLKAPTQVAGKSVRCPACETKFAVPAARPAPTLRAVPAPDQGVKPELRDPAPARAKPPSLKVRAGIARPRFFYVLFLLGLTPLALQTFNVASESDAELEQRLQHTVASQPELVEQLEGGLESAEAFFSMLPEGRIEGAHLPRDTWMHWIYGLIAAATFLGLIRLLFEPGRSTMVQLLLVLALTATVGVISLIAFQWIAEASQGVWLTGRSIVVVLFYIVKFIGFSYNAALNPENGFALSFFGFTCGVGLCEELTKVIPVVILVRNHGLDWRAACALGFVSGVGFGVAEGVMYSADMYNGLMTGDIYLTRFVSCVTLHAIWTAAASVMAAEKQDKFETNEGFDWLTHLLLVISVPAVLHGLYDTLLKRDMPGYALAIAAASFVWLMFVVERARSYDEPASRRFAPALG